MGTTSCNSEEGGPVNVTNGNMYLQQTDYRLPGFGGGLEITRTYNSQMQRAGLFGFGWSSFLDESINAYDPNFLRLNLADGRAVYLARQATTEPYLPFQPGALRSFFGLMGSYGVGVVNGFAGAARDTAQLPLDVVSDPLGTVDGILQDIGMRIVTLGQMAAHPVAGYDAIVDSIEGLGPNKTMEVLGNAGGQVIFVESLAKVTKMARYGREIEIGENCRVAPFGNRTGHRTGRWPHYHRRVPDPKRPGQGLPGRELADTGPGILSLQIVPGRIGFDYGNISD